MFERLTEDVKPQPANLFRKPLDFGDRTLAQNSHGWRGPRTSDAGISNLWSRSEHLAVASFCSLLFSRSPSIYLPIYLYLPPAVMYLSPFSLCCLVHIYVYMYTCTHKCYVCTCIYTCVITYVHILYTLPLLSAFYLSLLLSFSLFLSPSLYQSSLVRKKIKSFRPGAPDQLHGGLLHASATAAGLLPSSLMIVVLFPGACKSCLVLRPSPFPGVRRLF